jgi:hypothetical protein
MLLTTEEERAERRALCAGTLAQVEGERGKGSEHWHCDMVVRLCRDVDTLVGALRSVLPLDQEGGCFYCKLGNEPDEDGMHFDADNAWGADQRCLQHERYEEARAVLRESDAPAAPGPG